MKEATNNTAVANEEAVKYYVSLASDLYTSINDEEYATIEEAKELIKTSEHSDYEDNMFSDDKYVICDTEMNVIKYAAYYVDSSNNDVETELCEKEEKEEKEEKSSSDMTVYTVVNYQTSASDLIERGRQTIISSSLTAVKYLATKNRTDQVIVIFEEIKGEEIAIARKYESDKKWEAIEIPEMFLDFEDEINVRF